MIAGLEPDLLALAAAAALGAGVVKGAVGFALPMILVSVLGSLMPPETALAALILPTLATNLWQALGSGLAGALGVLRRSGRFIAVLLVTMAASAQLVGVLPRAALLAALGTVVTAFALLGLSGWRGLERWLRRPGAGYAAAVVAGLAGGLSGVWGPPTVAWLTARGLEREEHVVAQGVVYLAGSVMLVAAHLASGVLDAHTAPLSALLAVPALAGMALGRALGRRLDARRFRRATLAVLALAGLNLLRRAMAG
ncbi:MAG: sulfite exporter TauE/SafE family protein [Alphaproteobacteria bacterium]|nr:MAG: sulfite exporter TauE/SafE family protein [Alphaproteobacteria bacterium]